VEQLFRGGQARGKNYIINVMIPLRRRDDRFSLVVSMTGVKMADRLLQVGCADSARLGAIAAKVGLSGRAVAVTPDAASAARAKKGAAQAGALVEVEVAAPTRLPADDASFDLLVFDDTSGLFGAMDPGERSGAVREALRVLAPGGRVIVIGSGSPGWLGRLMSRPQAAGFDPMPVLQAEGFRSVRLLADREGLTFFEAIKRRD
jgi:ubiquinone/menaquinone biosynthesis C-methylase UbiE